MILPKNQMTEEDIKKITRVEAGKESRTTLENEIKFIEDAEKFISSYTIGKVNQPVGTV